MNISEKDYKHMPPELQALFVKLPNPERGEVVGLFPQTGVSSGGRIGNKGSASAARFFYCAKPTRAEKNAGVEGNNGHPTVKPLALMRYLARLTKTPTGGKVFDPFMGSGTTGLASVMEGREFYGIEKDAEYYGLAKQRIASA